VLAVEPLACPTCPARLRIIGFLTDPAVVARILTHLRAAAFSQLQATITKPAVVARILTHLRRTRPALFPPPRGRPPPPAGEPTVCRADADGFLYAHDLPPDD
jgi:hypothetical protein